LRSFRSAALVQAASSKKKTAKAARFVSFREPDGRFRFRFLAADGEELLLSRPFDDPKSVGQISQRLIARGADALELRDDESSQFTLWVDGECLADSPIYADPDALDAAMLRLREAIAGLAG
jgi:tryptophanyl-tRNA synthetase